MLAVPKATPVSLVDRRGRSRIIARFTCTWNRLLLTIRMSVIGLLLLGLTACAQHSSSGSQSSARSDAKKPSQTSTGVPASIESEFERAIQTIDSLRVIDEVSVLVNPDDWMQALLNHLDPYRDFMLQRDVDVIMLAASNLYQKMLAGDAEALKSLYDVVNWRMAITISQAPKWLRNEPPMRPKMKYKRPETWANDEKELRTRWRDKVFYMGLPDLVAGDQWTSVAKTTLNAYQSHQACLQQFSNGRLMSYAVSAYANLVGVDAVYTSLGAESDVTPEAVTQRSCDLPFTLSHTFNRPLNAEIFPVLAGGVATSVAVLTLPNFDGGIAGNQSLRNELAEHLHDFQRLGVSGVVVDLRGNSGSSIGGAVYVLEMLLGPGLLVQKKAFGGALSVVESLEGAPYNGALALLIDRHTAGAAEVFASAVQARELGFLIGERSKGRGTYKESTKLSAGRLDAVVGEYMTLKGQAINNIGVTPDIELSFMKTRPRHDAKSYMLALSNASSYVRPLRLPSHHLGVSLSYLKKQQKRRVQSSDVLSSYILMKRQEENYASMRNIMDVYSQKQVYKKLLSAQAKRGKAGVKDIERFHSLQIVQDWVGAKNSGLKEW